MEKEPDASLRVVLDTNVLLDLVVFDDPQAAPLRAAIESGRVVLLTSADCLAELHRVLAYPAFGLDAPGQQRAYEWFAARAQCVEVSAPVPPLPRCRDADDQKFLDLAWAARADWLVTKDKALLELARRVAKLGRFRVTTPGSLIDL